MQYNTGGIDKKTLPTWKNQLIQHEWNVWEFNHMCACVSVCVFLVYFSFKWLGLINLTTENERNKWIEPEFNENTKNKIKEIFHLL